MLVPWRVTFRSNGDFQGDQIWITLNHLVGMRVDFFGCSERRSHVSQQNRQKKMTNIIIAIPKSLVTLA